MRLSGKTAVITGASTGIGRACALRFAREGARLVLADRRMAEAESLPGEIERSGGICTVVEAFVARR
jgi:NAD(P)-dependent dehydrogenase (short-subunit alcohol dehydrogenase family)